MKTNVFEVYKMKTNVFEAFYVEKMKKHVFQELLSIIIEKEYQLK